MDILGEKKGLFLIKTAIMLHPIAEKRQLGTSKTM